MDPFLGEVRMFAGNFAPVGWQFCNGQLLNIAENDSLFNLLGTTYGGDGQTTFALPDLRGRTPIHMGQGPNLSPRNLGDAPGSEAVTLTPAQMPSHYHPVRASSKDAAQADPKDCVWAVVKGENRYTQAAPTITMSASCTTPAGGGQPHDNMMPFQAVSFIIATEGIYPPQG
jgi:microcystin-dependent protein